MSKDHDPNSPFQRRRRERLARWRAPLASRWDRLRAWISMIAVDHGIFRLLYLNRHRVGERAWRAAQPAPHQLRAFARAGGRTVVSLRGGQAFGSLPLEVEACEIAGLNYHNFVLRSRSLPTREELLAASALFERLEYPVLFHCKSGADRAGFMAALYLVIAEGRPVAEARRQLALRFGHIRQGKTGVLDAFFDAYERETQGQVGLAEWIATTYDRERITAEFHATGWGVWLVDRVLGRE
ncbi:MAG: sulfur transferase domain-containing protein [Pseudomonadota bacterium]